MITMTRIAKGDEMETEMIKYLNAIEKGEKISLVIAGLIVEGTFEDLVNNSVVLSSATSAASKKKEYHLTVPLESIYAWGSRKKKKKDKKVKEEV